jgi:hypothetical protein
VHLHEQVSEVAIVSDNTWEGVIGERRKISISAPSL